MEEKRIELEKDSEFYALADLCAKGDADAMARMGDWFQRRIVQENVDDPSFEEKTSNFWHYRARKKGSKAGETWYENWKKEHPGKPLRSMYTVQPTGEIDGWKLSEAGFLFFEPDVCYHLSAPSPDGVVEASVYCGDSGWDEDGFGSEIEYDWYFLDENLNPIPNVRVLRGWSRRDMDVLAGKEYRLRAAEELRKQKGK